MSEQVAATSSVEREVLSAKMSTGVSGASKLIAADLSEGDSVSYTIGAETFSPIKYNTFTVGPFTVSTSVRMGESAADAVARAAAVCGAMFSSAYELKRSEFFDRVGKLEPRS